MFRFPNPAIRLCGAVLLAALPMLCAAGAHAAPGARDPAYASFADDVMSAMKAQNQQVRMRQQRLRERRVFLGNGQAPVVPAIANDLTYAVPGKAPVALRGRTDAPPAGVAPGRAGRIGQTGTPPGPAAAGWAATSPMQMYSSGMVYADSREQDGAGLNTDAMTFGSDGHLAPDLVAGVATSFTRRYGVAGTTTTGYLSFEPLETVFLDVSAGFGMFHARHAEASLGLADTPRATATSFSMALSRQQVLRGWVLTPFGRIDELDADVTAEFAPSMPTRRARVVSFGSYAGTDVDTPFGKVCPKLTMEFQREFVGFAGSADRQSTTQRSIGLTMTTQMTRDIAAFAESSVRRTANADPTTRTLLGLRVLF